MSGPSGGTSLGDGDVIASTDKALKIELESGEEQWVPLSVIHDDSEVYDDEDNSSGEVIVKSWWADKEGLG